MINTAVLYRSPVATKSNRPMRMVLFSHFDDFGAAIGNAVGLDTDCNGATLGGLRGIQGDAILTHWTATLDEHTTNVTLTLVKN